MLSEVGAYVAGVCCSRISFAFCIPCLDSLALELPHKEAWERGFEKAGGSRRALGIPAGAQRSLSVGAGTEERQRPFPLALGKAHPISRARTAAPWQSPAQGCEE